MRGEARMEGRRGITVGIPAFNARKTLERAIESVLSQEGRTPYEVIVVDDGSTDTTANIALSYALRFSDRIRLIRTQNRGVAAARNTIVAEARYAHLTWLDADDYYFPNKLERQYDALMLHAMVRHDLPDNPDVILFSSFRMGKEIYTFNRYLPEPLADILSGAFRAYLWASLTATEAYRRTGPFNESLHRSEDTDWLLRYLLSGGKTVIATADGPVMNYTFSTDRNGAKVEDSFRFLLTTYGDEMRRLGVFEELVPRRWWEISNFYHRNKNWDDMWRCRAIAAYLDRERYWNRLTAEINALAPNDRDRVSAICFEHAKAGGVTQ